MAFRVMQQVPCPPVSHAPVDNVAAKFHTCSLDVHTSQTLSQLRQQAFRTVTQKTGDKLTIRLGDKRLRSLKKAAHPGLAKTRNMHLFCLLKAPYGKQAVRLWALA